MMNQSMQYGFNFEKGKKPKKYKLSKEEKKKLKEWEYLQQLRLKKIKDDEMQQFLSSTADTNSTKFIIPNEYNHVKASKTTTTKTTQQGNHWSKYPKVQPSNDRKDDENPAIIIDDGEERQGNLKGKQFQKRNDKHHSNGNNNNNKNNDYSDNVSRDESMIAFSDTLMLKSASQVPCNMQNPAYLYEEQEGSIDLRSEYSFYSKNAPKSAKHPNDNIMNNMSNVNKKSHEDNKTFCEYKDINSWKDVY